MPLDKESVEDLLLNRHNAKSKEERDEYDELYHETRRRLAIERAQRDDARAAGQSGRKLTTRNPRRPLIWKDV